MNFISFQQQLQNWTLQTDQKLFTAVKTLTDNILDSSKNIQNTLKMTKYTLRQNEVNMGKNFSDFLHISENKFTENKIADRVAHEVQIVEEKKAETQVKSKISIYKQAISFSIKNLDIKEEENRQTMSVSQVSLSQAIFKDNKIPLIFGCKEYEKSQFLNLFFDQEFSESRITKVAPKKFQNIPEEKSLGENNNYNIAPSSGQANLAPPPSLQKTLSAPQPIRNNIKPLIPPPPSENYIPPLSGVLPTPPPPPPPPPPLSTTFDPSASFAQSFVSSSFPKKTPPNLTQSFSFNEPSKYQPQDIQYKQSIKEAKIQVPFEPNKPMNFQQQLAYRLKYGKNYKPPPIQQKSNVSASFYQAPIQNNSPPVEVKSPVQTKKELNQLRASSNISQLIQNSNNIFKKKQNPIYQDEEQQQQDYIFGSSKTRAKQKLLKNSQLKIEDRPEKIVQNESQIMRESFNQQSLLKKKNIEPVEKVSKTQIQKKESDQDQDLDIFKKKKTTMSNLPTLNQQKKGSPIQVLPSKPQQDIKKTKNTNILNDNDDDIFAKKRNTGAPSFKKQAKVQAIEKSKKNRLFNDDEEQDQFIMKPKPKKAIQAKIKQQDIIKPQKNNSEQSIVQKQQQRIQIKSKNVQTSSQVRIDVKNNNTEKQIKSLPDITKKQQKNLLFDDQDDDNFMKKPKKPEVKKVQKPKKSLFEDDEDDTFVVKPKPQKKTNPISPQKQPSIINQKSEKSETIEKQLTIEKQINNQETKQKIIESNTFDKQQQQNVEHQQKEHSNIEDNANQKINSFATRRNKAKPNMLKNKKLFQDDEQQINPAPAKKIIPVVPKQQKQTIKKQEIQKQTTPKSNISQIAEPKKVVKTNPLGILGSQANNTQNKSKKIIGMTGAPLLPIFPAGMQITKPSQARKIQQQALGRSKKMEQENKIKQQQQKNIQLQKQQQQNTSLIQQKSQTKDDGELQQTIKIQSEKRAMQEKFRNEELERQRLEQQQRIRLMEQQRKNEQLQRRKIQEQQRVKAQQQQKRINEQIQRRKRQEQQRIQAQQQQKRINEQIQRRKKQEQQRIQAQQLYRKQLEYEQAQRQKKIKEEAERQRIKQMKKKQEQEKIRLQIQAKVKLQQQIRLRIQQQTRIRLEQQFRKKQQLRLQEERQQQQKLPKIFAEKPSHPKNNPKEFAPKLPPKSGPLGGPLSSNPLGSPLGGFNSSQPINKTTTQNILGSPLGIPAQNKKPIQNSKPIQPVKNKLSGKKGGLFGQSDQDDDNFGSKFKPVQKKKPLTGNLSSKKGGLFDDNDDDQDFTLKSKKVQQKQPANIGKNKRLFNDDDDDDFFSKNKKKPLLQKVQTSVISQQPEPYLKNIVEPQPIVEAKKSKNSSALFNDDQDDSIFPAKKRQTIIIAQQQTISLPKSKLKNPLKKGGLFKDDDDDDDGLDFLKKPKPSNPKQNEVKPEPIKPIQKANHYDDDSEDDEAFMKKRAAKKKIKNFM